MFSKSCFQPLIDFLIECNAIVFSAFIGDKNNIAFFVQTLFVAIIQLFIYVGAVIILFIFAIMLTANIGAKALRQTNSQIVGSLAVAAGLLAVILILISRPPWHSTGVAAPPVAIDQIGRLMFTTYLLPFEVISLILLAALVGAIVIGRRKEE